jgi:enamine deaminase RidA (YjgF/YER057c/UK114 family)
MEKTQVNPWTWQDQWGFSQGWKVDGAKTLIFVSGQASISANGEVVHQDDFKAQARLTLENLKTVLEKAGASLDNIVKLTGYFINMENLPDFGAIQAEFFKGHAPASTVVGVTSLALPGMLVEVEAYAVV